MPYVRRTRVDTNGQKWKSSISNYGVRGQGYSGQFPKSVQMIFSESHPYHKRSNGKWDTGGEFESWKIRIPYLGVPEFTSRYLYQDLRPTGPVGWNTETTTFLVPSAEIAQLATQINGLTSGDSVSAYLSNPVRCPQGPDVLTMDAMGTKAIDLVKPTNPTADVATTLAELWSERKFFSVPGKDGSLSGEYLNYQFGIAPTAGFIQDLRGAIENRDAIIRQYQRDSGKNIRRSFHFEDVITRTRTTSTAPVYGMGNGLSFNQCPSGSLIKRTTTTQKYWFSGNFKYTIPQGAWPAKLRELDRLYGVVPGVSTGWELLPFSWLVDYFTPIGGILSNLDAFMQDGLVMPYAYIMSTTEVVDEYDWYGQVRGPDGTFQGLAVYARVEKTRLRRRHANPFGFGLLATDLSPKQLSILAALGISLRK